MTTPCVRGLKVSQLNILIVAAKLGLARPAQVCEILQLDASTLSRNVERMRAQGWLEVVPEEDARAQPFRLTPQGKRLIEKATPAWEQAQRQASSCWGTRGSPCSTRPPRSWRTGEADDPGVFFLGIVAYTTTRTKGEHHHGTRTQHPATIASET